MQIAVVAAGVGVLVAGSPTAFTVIRYTGAASLVFLGIRQWRSPVESDLGDGGQPRIESRRSMIWRGILVNLTNPKAIIFFVAFIPQFIRSGEPLLAQYVELAATIVVIDIVVMWCFFATAAKGLRRITRSASGQRGLHRLFGGLFIGVGVLLATIHRPVPIDACRINPDRRLV